LLYYSYDVNGDATYGRLGTDRPHQFKFQGTYDLPWGTMVGVNALVESGVPKSTIMSEKNINFFPYGRGNLDRTPTFSQVDLLVQQEFRLPSNMRVMIGLNAINLFDQETGTGYQTTPYRDGFNVSDATFFGGFDPVAVAAAQNFRPEARFGMASGFQDPRVIRIQAKFSF
jgi:hypothetical protein